MVVYMIRGGEKAICQEGCQSDICAICNSLNLQLQVKVECRIILFGLHLAQYGTIIVFMVLQYKDAEQRQDSGQYFVTQSQTKLTYSCAVRHWVMNGHKNHW